MDHVIPTKTLNSGAELPMLGLGTVASNGDAENVVVDAVAHALRSGYRAIDTAMIYHNEALIGRALRESGVRREDVFVISKVWNEDVRNGTEDAALDRSLEQLGLDYIDLYLVHWPIEGKLRSSWAALEEGHRDGRARAIGTANYLPAHLKELAVSSSTVPAVNQIEFHPWLQQKDIVDYCTSLGIAVQGWRPLGKGEVLNESVVRSFADEHNRTPAQVLLRWAYQRGVATIPKSFNLERIEQNAQIFSFALTDAQMQAIDALETGRRLGADPNDFDF